MDEITCEENVRKYEEDDMDIEEREPSHENLEVDEDLRARIAKSEFKEIKMSNGMVIKCSPDDYDQLSLVSWSLSSKGYPKTNINGKTVAMSHIITKAKTNAVVDHVNNDKLDHRSLNLRISTTGKNAKNKAKQKGRSSAYKGVSYTKKDDVYHISFMRDGKIINLGDRKVEIDGAELFDTYVVQNGLEADYKLNFPEKRNEYLNRPQVIPVKQENSTGYKGVGVYKGGYFARIHDNRKTKTIYCKTKLEAAKAYDKHVVEHGLKKTLNFPEDYVGYKPKEPTKTEAVEYPDDLNSLRLVIKSRPNIVVLIDRDQYERIRPGNCHEHTDGYIVFAYNGKQHLIHRYLMDITDENVDVDHENGNRYDNRLSNLRPSNDTQNGANKNKGVNASSDYYGVTENFGKGTFTGTVGTAAVIIDTDEVKVARKRDLYLLTFYPERQYKKSFVWTAEDIATWTQKFADEGSPIVKKNDQLDVPRKEYYTLEDVVPKRPKKKQKVQ